MLSSGGKGSTCHRVQMAMTEDDSHGLLSMSVSAAGMLSTTTTVSSHGTLLKALG